MKYLDLASFVPVNEWLASMECAGHVISGRLEAYSCKKTSSDRKLYKSLQMSGSFSASEEAASMSSSGIGIALQTSEPTLAGSGTLSPPQAPHQAAAAGAMLTDDSATATAVPSQQNKRVLLGKPDAEVGGSRGFAHAALLVRHRDHFAIRHMGFLLYIDLAACGEAGGYVRV